MGSAQTEDSNPGVAPAFAALWPLFPVVAISALNESFALEMRETQSQEKQSTKCIIVWHVISGLSNRLLDAAVLIFFTSLPRGVALIRALSTRLHCSLVSLVGVAKLPQRERQLWRNFSRSSGDIRSQRSSIRCRIRRRILER
jgi:hypothetical protein